MRAVVQGSNVVVLDESSPHIRNTQGGTTIRLDVNSGVFSIDMYRQRKLAPPRRGKGTNMSRLKSTSTKWYWEMVWYITATRPGYERHHFLWEVRRTENVSTRLLTNACTNLPKTRAFVLKRLSKRLEPNRRTVWPIDTPVLPRRIYIDSDS